MTQETSTKWIIKYHKSLCGAYFRNFTNYSGHLFKVCATPLPTKIILSTISILCHYFNLYPGLLTFDMKCKLSIDASNHVSLETKYSRVFVTMILSYYPFLEMKYRPPLKIDIYENFVFEDKRYVYIYIYTHIYYHVHQLLINMYWFSYL